MNLEKLEKKTEIRNILLKIKYDGSKFHGWQKQLDVITVQETLEEAIKASLKIENVTIKGSSRTDTGVHAVCFPASFLLDVPIPLEKIKTTLNGRLPEAVRVMEVMEKPISFHPRFEAKGKNYVYRIIQGRDKSPFMNDYAYQLEYDLDIEKMKIAAKQMEGKKDFASFQAAGGTEKLTTVREIFSVKIEERKIESENGFLPEYEITGKGKKIIDISVTGDGFLYNMVRIMTGTLVDVGRGKIEAAKVNEIILSKDRENAGHTAPACGLYLKEVFFD